MKKVSIIVLVLFLFILVKLLILPILDADYTAYKEPKIRTFDKNFTYTGDSASDWKLMNNQINNRFLYTSPIYFSQFLDSIDSVNGDKIGNEMLLMKAIMSKFNDTFIIASDLKEINYDTLQHVMEFVDIYWAASEINGDRAIFFRTIASLFTGKLSRTLLYFSKNQPDLVHSPKFYYLSEFCGLKSMPVNLTVPKTTKFFLHFANQRWSHLINATWSDASLSLRIIVIVFGLFSLASYLSLFVWILRKIKKKN